MADEDTLKAIKEILRLDNIIKEKRSSLRKIEKDQAYYRDLLKKKYGDNTIIKTNLGNITIREKITEGKLSLEELRDIFDTVDWIGYDTKEKLLLLLESFCENKRKYSKTLTIKKGRSMSKTSKRNRNKENRHNGNITQE